MDSTPPIRRTSASPHQIDRAAMFTASRLEAHRRLTVTPGTLSGKPASSPAGLLAGLPDSVPGVTVNRLCASSLEAVNMAARSIWCGDADVLLIGGVESMSRSPYSVPRNATGKPTFGNMVAYDTALG